VCKFEGLMVYKMQVYCLCVVVFIFKMGRACVACGRQESCMVFWWGRSEGKSHMEDLDIDGRIILKWILKM
jgi:hypothetical protein